METDTLASSLPYLSVFDLFVCFESITLHYRRFVPLTSCTPRKRDGPKVEEVKTSSSPSVHVDVDVDVDDDFNRAEGKFFHAVENIEKKAITVAHDLIHDEVDVLFGKDHGHHEQENSIDMDGDHDHDHDHAFHLPIFGGRRRGSGSAFSKKNHVHQVTSSTKVNDTDNNEEETDEKFLNFMESYAENCFNPHGGW